MAKQLVKPCPKGTHTFSYRGGEAPCTKCGWFCQPNGDVTKSPTGRGIKQVKGARKPTKAKKK